MPKATNIDDDIVEEKPKKNLKQAVLDLIDNDPEIRGRLVLEGELRPEAYKYPRITMVNGQKQKR